MINTTVFTDSDSYRMKMIILKPDVRKEKIPGILWIHGGGYMTGMAEMIHFSRGKDLAERLNGIVISPEYRLAYKEPYPAALNDCYAALEYMWDHADEMGINREKIIVGGESAGGGLAVAVCLLARDKGKIKIAMQIPLYPMIDCEDTESSADNHGRIWNTRRNHWGWRNYLGNLWKTDEVPVYASPAKETDYSNLPPCYTFVCNGEPFYSETVTYINNLRKAKVKAEMDTYVGDVHAFDMLLFWTAQAKHARKKLLDTVEEIL